MGGQAPSPIQSGISRLCTQYAQAQSGDGCYSLTSLWQISESDFYTWNTVLGLSGVNCSTQHQASYWYSIGVPEPTTTSAAPTLTSTLVPAPSPVQSGINPQYIAFAKAKSGGNCIDFARGNDLTPAQLYPWNPVLGQTGVNCNTLFQANTYYCIGVPTPTTTPTTTKAPLAPGLTQTGIISTCNKYVEAKSGEYCEEFAQNNQITPSQLYAWNNILGADGSRFSTEF